MLTRKQSEALTIISDGIRRDGVPPTFEEIKNLMGLKSKSGVHRMVLALEERGFLRRLPNRTRALEILKPLKPNLEAPEPAMPGTVPMMGRIAAGVPVSAIQVNSGNIQVPPGLLGSGEHFALEVVGESMRDAGISDGDTVILRRVDDAESGAIVVALVDDEEATLKRLRKSSGTIRLEPANPDYEVRSFAASRVKVQGRLVALLRSYA